MAQADVEATVVEPPPKKARVARACEDKYDIAVQELAKADEAIAAIERKIKDQKDGENRVVIIVRLEKEMSDHQKSRIELADIIVSFVFAWDNISPGADQTEMLLQCVGDLEELMSK